MLPRSLRPIGPAFLRVARISRSAAARYSGAPAHAQIVENLPAASAIVVATRLTSVSTLEISPTVTCALVSTAALAHEQSATSAPVAALCALADNVSYVRLSWLAQDVDQADTMLTKPESRPVCAGQRSRHLQTLRTAVEAERWFRSHRYSSRAIRPGTHACGT